MRQFRELIDFERRFDEMEVAELEHWKDYWTRHAQGLAPKIRRQAMKRVYTIEKAIERKGGSAPVPSESDLSEVPSGGSLNVSATKKAQARAGRIMYIECKAGSLVGDARIGRVTFSQTGRTLHYRGHRFQSLKGAGFKSNYYDVDTREDYWISGPKRSGADGLYSGSQRTEIDEDVREEYWREIRRQPERIHESLA